MLHVIKGGPLFFMQRCWGQGVNLQFLCSHSHSSVNIICNTFFNWKKDRDEKRSAQAGKKCEDFDWVSMHMLEDGSLTKQTIAVLDKYLRNHIDCQGRKKAKLNEVQRHITNHLAVTQKLREQDSDTDESEEDEVVTCDECDE